MEEGEAPSYMLGRLQPGIYDAYFSSLADELYIKQENRIWRYDTWTCNMKKSRLMESSIEKTY